MKLIYVAGLYRGFTPERIELNTQAAMHVGVLLAERGYMPVIPHKNTEKMELYTNKCDDQFWLDGTMELLKAVNAVGGGILMLQGWRYSPGAHGERDYANHRHMPIFFDVDDVNL